MVIFAGDEIKNPAKEKEIFSRRLVVVLCMIFALLMTVLVRVCYLQIWAYKDLLGQWENFHVRLRSIPPERGLIHDNRGRVLAGNVFSYALYVHPLHVKDIDQLLARLDPIIALDQEQLESFHQRFQSVRRRNELVLLKEILTDQEIAKIAVDKYHLTGVEIQPRYRRFYPHDEVVSHLLGYIGRISPEDQLAIVQEEYRGLDQIGKLGLEKFYETELRGHSGVEEVGVDVHGHVVKVYQQKTAMKGKDLHLWLDLDVQRFAWRVLDGHIGSILVADVNSGGILAMVNRPAYDNNQFVLGLSQEQFKTLTQQPGAPMLNRAVAGRYPPGSTIKPFYAVQALGRDLVTPEFSIYDRGYFRLQGSNLIFRNWKRSGHGKVAMRRALRVSSDTYFYQLALLAGHENMYEWLSEFGFGNRTAEDVYDEIALALPTPEWKIEHHNLPWFPGDTVNMGIGQGYFTATPMQLLTATLILANKGRFVRPQMVRHITGRRPVEQPDKQVIQARSQDWDLVFKGMQDVLHNQHEGTAKLAGEGLTYRMAGKTGTSQVVSLAVIERARERGRAIKKEWLDHALFIAFAPADNPKYAIVVVLENGIAGLNAAKLARRVMDYLILVKKPSDS